MSLTDELHGELAEGLDALQLPAELAPRLLAYLELLARWNRTYNLTSVREPREMLRRHPAQARQGEHQHEDASGK